MDPQTRGYLGFHLTPGIGAARLARLVEYFGSAQAAWSAPSGALLSAGLEPRLVRALLHVRTTVDLDAELARVTRAGAALFCSADPRYPQALSHAPQPPPLIYVRGELLPTDNWAIAVVGTRTPSHYGREVARQIVTDLVSAGVTIVSGLALGIDGVAHEAALAAGGRTIAVLGSGIDQIYPERHRTLAERIVTQGALVAEVPLGTRPTPLNFPPRNRIISGLCRGTLVVEAREQSGALITVTFALEQGREVFAVPGPVNARLSAGTNAIIRNGATLVRSARDILEQLDWTRADAQLDAQLALPTDPAELAVLGALEDGPQPIDEVGVRCARPAAEIGALLTLLELKGFVRQIGPQTYARSG